MKKRIKTPVRITILYTLFVLSVAAALFFGATSQSFHTSLVDLSQLEKDASIDDQYSDFLYAIDLTSSYDDFGMAVSANADSTIVVSARPVSVDLKIDASRENEYVGNVWSFILNYAVMAIMILGFAILLCMLVSIAKSLKNEECFSRRNIHRVRWIGILQIADSLLNSLYFWVDNNTAAKLFIGSGYTVDTAFHPNYDTIIIGLVILFIGEVFAVGYDLSQENKLTI